MKLAATVLVLWIVGINGFTYEKGPVAAPAPCPGRYCGRVVSTEDNKTVWSACGACPRGHQADQSWTCVPCNELPTTYDWMYLCFMVLSGLLLQWYGIDAYSDDHSLSLKTLTVHAWALAETCLASVLTLLINQPIGSLRLQSCRVRQLSDWYTQLHNPQPNYEETLYCSNEAVYPLYSLVFVHYGLSVLLLLFLRPLAHRLLNVRGRRASRPLYFALYFFPVLALIHALMAGLIYYAFPSVVILLSLMSHAFHFSCRPEQAWRPLLVETVSSARNLFIVLGHWLLHGYGLLALTLTLQPDQATNLLLLLLAPLPTLLYLALVRYTDPKML